jgi:hypothetical protein
LAGHDPAAESTGNCIETALAALQAATVAKNIRHLLYILSNTAVLNPIQFFL